MGADDLSHQVYFNKMNQVHLDLKAHNRRERDRFQRDRSR